MPDYTGLVVLNYRLVEKLGEGGFGTVFLAEHQELGRKVAVKILHAEYARRKDVVERFFREARAVCAIGHKSIVDVQNFARLDSGEPYYLMEYFDGESLAEAIDGDEPPEPTEIIAVFDAVASALTAAHDKSIIHRDLKPENIMLRRARGEVQDVRLLDFGIAKLTDSSDQVNSRTGFTIGTPMYMAPEQARDAKNVDERADVYSFAATLFHAVAGRPPFVEPTVTELVVAVQTKTPPPLRQFAPAASQELEAVLARCLSKHPGDRPRSIAEAWSLLRAALEAPQPAAGSRRSRTGTLRGVNPTPPQVSSNPAVEPEQSARFAKTVANKAQTTLGSASSEVAGAVEPPPSRKKLFGAIAVVGLVTGVVAIAAVDGEDTEVAGGPAPPVADAAVAEIAADAAVRHIADAATPQVLDAAAVVSVDAGQPSIDPECSPQRFEAIAAIPSRQQRARAARAAQRRLRRCRDQAGLTPAQLRAIRRQLQSMAQTEDCSRERFARIYRASRPSKSSVDAALAALARCRSELSATTRGDIERALRDKLKPPIECSVASFAAVYGSTRPAVSAVRAAQSRLRACVARGKRSSQEARSIAARLEAALRPPEPDCSRQSFAVVYQASSPDATTVRAALRRLRTCKPKLGSSTYQEIQRALLKKL